MSGWTKDKTGNHVNWLGPQYKQGPLLSLVLDGEDYHKLSPIVRQLRLHEYRRLRERANPLEIKVRP